MASESVPESGETDVFDSAQPTLQPVMGRETLQKPPRGVFDDAAGRRLAG